MGLSTVHRRRQCGRRGGTLAGLLITLSLMGAMSVTAVVVPPRYLAAGSVQPQVQAARADAHQEQIDALAALIGRSVGVLAIQQRGPTPYLEMVLWLQDDDSEGIQDQADESELAVLCHSQVLRTITIYRLADGEEAAAGGRWDARPPAGAAFCDRWRADPRVGSMVLIAGVSDMWVEPLEPPQEGSQRLRIELTWASDSADGADEASVLVDAVVSAAGDGE